MGKDVRRYCQRLIVRNCSIFETWQSLAALGRCPLDFGRMDFHSACFRDLIFSFSLPRDSVFVAVWPFAPVMQGKLVFTTRVNAASGLVSSIVMHVTLLQFSPLLELPFSEMWRCLQNWHKMPA